MIAERPATRARVDLVFWLEADTWHDTGLVENELGLHFVT